MAKILDPVLQYVTGLPDCVKYLEVPDTVPGKQQKGYDLPREIREVTAKLLAGLNTPRALTVSILVRNKEWGQLVQLRVDPSAYRDDPFSADKLRRDLQATEFLRKAEDIVISDIDKKQVALDTFWAAEAQCKKTNDRLDRWLHHPTFECQDDARLFDFIEKVQNTIAKWLGPIPKELDGRFGPGTVFEAKGWWFNETMTIGDKMQHMAPAVTSSAKPIFESVFWDSAWGRAWMSDTSGRAVDDSLRGNRFTTVVKDATTYRGICIEGGAMVFLQLAIGSVIRRRLLAIGIDLDNGQATHQQLAEWGSLTGLIATIDLKTASDTNAVNCTKLLLAKAKGWYDLLSSLRSPFTLVEGRWVRLEKFSSMGNGFTFELETLIFLAIAATVCGGLPGKDVHVFGDDIIVPVDAARATCSALKYFGFTPNERKTFITGAFRESCGGDYFMGYNVRPYYLKEFPTEPHQWIAMANGLFRRGRNAHLRIDPLFRARFYVLGLLPSDIRRCRGPSALGDLLVNDVPENWVSRTRESRRWFRVWRPVQIGRPFAQFSPAVQMAIAVYGAKPISRKGKAMVKRSDGSKTRVIHDFLPYRDNVGGYRFGRLSYS